MTVRRLVIWCAGACIGGAALLPLPGLVGMAAAQEDWHPCDGTPGERQIGTTPGGNGIAPTPMCVVDEAPSSRSRGSSASQADAAVAAANSMTAAFDQMVKLMSNPEMIAYKSGTLWKYSFESGKCGAVHLNPNGILALYAPTRAFDKVVTIYQAPGIPKAAAPRQVKVQLEEQDLATGKVQRMTADAIHDDDSIFIMYPAKFYPQVLASMKDRARYKAFLNKRQVLDITLQDGLEARRQLQRCRS